MKHTLRIPALLSTAAWLAAASTLFAGDPAMTPIFNGKDLSGWKTKGEAQFFVRDGCLVGTQDTGKGGDITTEAEYGDFELRATYKMKWPGNSGFWFRFNPATSKGYQFDILKYAKPVAYSGTIYCPGKLFLTTNLVESVENRDDWNQARIWAKGDHLVVWLNGKRVGDCTEASFQKGAIGIQVHGGDAAKGMAITVKDFKIREIPAGEAPPTD